MGARSKTPGLRKVPRLKDLPEDLRLKFINLTDRGFTFEHYFNKEEMKPLVEKTGRPSALTPQVYANLLENLMVLCSVELACEYSGISYDAANAWVNKGLEEHAHPCFAEFSQNYRRAEMRFEVAANQALYNKSVGQMDAGALKFVLAVRKPEKYGQRRIIEGGEKPLEVHNKGEVVFRVTDEAAFD